MVEVAPGLRRWTAYHEHWEEQVGSLALETDEGLVLIDPIDPPRGLRSTAELKPKRVWAHTRSAQPLRNRGVQVTDAFKPADELPGGLEAFATARVNEVVFWLPKHRSLAVGDVLLGAGAKPRATRDALRFCPERWLGKGTHDDLRETLRPLLALPVQRVLVSHGEPVLRAGKTALARVLAD
jgi:hypothetical protein